MSSMDPEALFQTVTQFSITLWVDHLNLGVSITHLANSFGS